MSVTKEEAAASHFFASETGHSYPNGLCSCGRIAPHPGKPEPTGTPRPLTPPTKEQWNEWKRRGIF